MNVYEENKLLKERIKLLEELLQEKADEDVINKVIIDARKDFHECCRKTSTTGAIAKYISKLDVNESVGIIKIINRKGFVLKESSFRVLMYRVAEEIGIICRITKFRKYCMVTRVA